MRAHAGPNTAADAFPNSRARRSDEGSHTQSHAGAVATSNAATNYPGALTCADARSNARADATPGVVCSTFRAAWVWASI